LAGAPCSVRDLIHLIPQFICELGFSRGLISRVEDDLWTPQLMFVVDDPVWAQTLTRLGSARPQRLDPDLWETELVRTRRSIIATDVQAQPWRSHAGLAPASGTRSYVAAPLISDDEVVGILHAERYGQRRDVDEFDRQLLDSFAEAAQLALSRAATVEAVESVGECLDALTQAVREARSPGRQIPELTLELDSTDSTSGLIVRGGTGDELSRPLPPGLSPREMEVLRLMAAGKSNATIAYQLSIADGTVKQHVKHVLRKLLVGTRAEAVSRWYQAGGKR
jgi:DNA-binding NarL/FixJ family response regulator